jgi:hypothetical protein
MRPAPLRQARPVRLAIGNRVNATAAGGSTTPSSGGLAISRKFGEDFVGFGAAYPLAYLMALAQQRLGVRGVAGGCGATAQPGGGWSGFVRGRRPLPGRFHSMTRPAPAGPPACTNGSLTTNR